MNVISEFGDIASRSLLGAAAHADSSNHTGEDVCYCLHPHVLGSATEHTAAMACSWVAFCVSLLILGFYAYHSW